MKPPCCEKSGMKKGPWSPEEDLLLASYVHEHGAGNWRAVPANTGLMRCRKSCRLRWTNYLCPGIKRGNFSDQEEKLIIHLQLLLGNKWSTIASYMPERTDNDIKNFFNTHLKRKITKMGATESGASGSTNTKGNRAAAAADKGQWERRLQTDMHSARQAFQEVLSMNTVPPSMKPEPLAVPNISPAMNACSVDNIARLLEDWPMCPSANGKALAVSDDGEGGSGRHSGTAHTLEAITRTRKVESAGGAGLPPSSSSSLPMLESWLLDDDMGHGDAGLLCVPLADPCKLF